MPVHPFSRLTGPYLVGTSIQILTDPVRSNRIYGKDSKRLLPIQIWYPLKKSDQVIESALLAPYVSEAKKKISLLKKEWNLSVIPLSYLTQISGRSYLQDSVKVQAGLPIIIFSHGLRGWGGESTFIMEQLASEGYIVISVEHPFDAIASVGSQGDAVLSRAITTDSSTRQERAEQVLEWTAIRVGDLKFVVNHLKSILGTQVSSSRIGLLGRGLGGAAASGFCSLDSRCAVGVSMDGVPSGGIAYSGTHAPFVFLMAETFFGGVLADHRIQARARVPFFGSPSHRFFIRGTAHWNFSDLPLLSPYHRSLQLTGPIDGARGLEVTLGVLKSAFDRHLKREKAPRFEDLLKKYPELRPIPGSI
jgi:dienelactone hydrolase